MRSYPAYEAGVARGAMSEWEKSDLGQMFIERTIKKNRILAALICSAVHTLVLCLGISTAVAEGKVAARQPETKAPKKLIRSSALDAISVFRPDFVKRGFFEGAEINDVTDEASVALQKKAAPEKNQEDVTAEKSRGPVFVGDFKPDDLLSPDEDPRIRINKEAPAPFIAMAVAHQNGDTELASKYADQWVRYQQNFFFEIRELTDLIGQALIRQRVIQDEDWDGVGQLIDYEFAKTRKESGEILKPTHEKAMERIKPDSAGEAEVYYFFSLNCSHCRPMAPDVERLWRVLKNDRKIKMVALTLGPTRRDFMDEYRKYTGLTMPVFEGEKVAKVLRIKFAPTLVVVSPNGNQAYIKTGQQDFGRMYDFVRRVQGLPSSLTPEIQQLVQTPIGEMERLQRSGQKSGVLRTAARRESASPALSETSQNNKVEIDKF